MAGGANRSRSVKELLRSELRWRNVCPRFRAAEPFVTPLWHMPSAVFVMYRVVVCVYLNVWLAVISYWAVGYASALMYFTAWGYILLCFSTSLLAALAIQQLLAERRRCHRHRGRTDHLIFGEARASGAAVSAMTPGCQPFGSVAVGDCTGHNQPLMTSQPAGGARIDGGDDTVVDVTDESACLRSPSTAFTPATLRGAAAGIPDATTQADGHPVSACDLRRGRRTAPWKPRDLLIRVAWVSHSVASVAAPLITFAYFCVLVPLSSAGDAALLLNAANLQLHAANTLVFIIEALLCATPSPLAFVVYSDAFFAAYVVANVSYWSVDPEHNVLYPVIGDWGNHWQVGLPLTVVALLIGIPLIHVVHFVKYRLQVAAYERFYGRRYPYDDICDDSCSDAEVHEGAAATGDAVVQPA